MKKILNLKSLSTLLLLILMCSFSSCNLKKDETIIFDTSNPLALAPDVSWCVVTEPYAAYKNETDWNSESNDHCRRGEILQVLGKSLDKNQNSWFLFEKGWLPATSIMVFDNRYKAEAYSKKLEQK